MILRSFRQYPFWWREGKIKKKNQAVVVNEVCDRKSEKVPVDTMIELSEPTPNRRGNDKLYGLECFSPFCRQTVDMIDLAQRDIYMLHKNEIAQETE